MNKKLINKNEDSLFAQQMSAQHRGSSIIIPIRNLYEFYSRLKSKQLDGSVITFIEKEMPNLKLAFEQISPDRLMRLNFDRVWVENEIFMQNKDEIQQILCDRIDFGRIYGIQEIKNILGRVYAELNICKKPTLTDLKKIFKVEVLPNKRFTKILDFKFSKQVA